MSCALWSSYYYILIMNDSCCKFVKAAHFLFLFGYCERQKEKHTHQDEWVRKWERMVRGKYDL